MEARSNTDLTQEQLRGYADAVVAGKRQQLAEWQPPLRMKGDDPRAVYEDHRDVAVIAMTAALKDEQIFEHAKLLDWAATAGISAEAALTHMPQLQRAVANATAAYNIEIANALRPARAPRRFLKILFAPNAPDPLDEEFDRLTSAFKAQPQAFGRPMPPSAASALATGVASSRTTTVVADEIKVPSTIESGAAPLVAALHPMAGQDVLVTSGHLKGPDQDQPSPDADTPESVPVVESKTVSSGETAPPIVGKADDTDAEIGRAVQDNAPDSEQADYNEVPCAAPSDQEHTTDVFPGEWDGRLSTIWPTIVDQKIAMGEWEITRRSELTSTIRIFVRLLGDVSILNLTRDQASEFRRKYLTLPTDHKNMWYDREKKVERTYEELIGHVASIEAKSGSKLKRVSGKTWNKQKGTFRSAIAWIKANRDLGENIKNPFVDLSVKHKKSTQAARLERSMATSPSLTVLFASPCWTGRANEYHLTKPGDIVIRDSLYWTPLFETCLGMRREEVCQLRVRHFTRKFGYLGIDLFAEDISVKVEDGASRRWIPLSTHMLNLGVVESLILDRPANELLFPELSNNNAHRTYGDSFGKRFLYYVKHVKVNFRTFAEARCNEVDIEAQDREKLIQQSEAALEVEFRAKTNNHAIRHWFKTVLENAGAKTIFVEEVMGHSNAYQKSEGGRYMKEVFVENLKASVDMVPVPFNPVHLRRLAETSEQNRAKKLTR